MSARNSLLTTLRQPSPSRKRVTSHSKRNAPSPRLQPATLRDRRRKFQLHPPPTSMGFREVFKVTKPAMEAVGSRVSGKIDESHCPTGDVMGGGPRDVAEHFMELHSSRILADDSRNRHHSPRKDYLQSELKVEDVITYLERLRERAERVAPPSRRTQETQTVPAALLPVTSTFLLQELPSSPAPQHLHQVRGTEHSRSVVRRSPSVIYFK